MASNVGAIDFVLDTNSVWKLAKLSDHEWSSVVRRCSEERFRTGWIPWVLAELIGTNLRRDLSRDYLAETQQAVRRYDTLAEGTILRSSDELVFLWTYELAAKDAPAYTGPNWTTNLREAVDHFLTIVDPKQIEFVPGKNIEIIYKDLTLISGYQYLIPVGFEPQLRNNVARAASQEGGLNNVVKDSVTLLHKWLPSVAERLGIPAGVMRSAMHAENALSGPWLRGLLECHYYLQRAHGVLAKIEENDGHDIDIGSYAGISTLFITEDGRLARSLKAVLGAPERVMSFAEFSSGLKA